MTAPDSGQGPADPFELWRQIYEANEKAWNAVLEHAVATPSYAESQGKVLETILAGQKAVRESMRTYLETINVPTREDIARLGELIVGLEEKVDQLDDHLRDLAAEVARQRADTVSVPPASAAPPPAPAQPEPAQAASTKSSHASRRPATRRPAARPDASGGRSA